MVATITVQIGDSIKPARSPRRESGDDHRAGVAAARGQYAAIESR